MEKTLEELVADVKAAKRAEIERQEAETERKRAYAFQLTAEARQEVADLLFRELNNKFGLHVRLCADTGQGEVAEINTGDPGYAVAKVIVAFVTRRFAPADDMPEEDHNYLCFILRAHKSSNKISAGSISEFKEKLAKWIVDR